MKKAKYIFSSLLLVIAALVCQSCSDDDNDDAQATTLSVSLNGKAIDKLSCPVGETSTMLSVDADGRWEASIPDADTAWISITPHEAYGWNVKDSTASNASSYMKVVVKTNRGAARTSAITFTAGGLTKTVTVEQLGTSTDPNDPFESAWEMISHLSYGYNLGNTLESNPSGDWWDQRAPHSVTDWETAWGQPVTTQQIIDDIKSKGINIIRVPVTWGPHMDANNQVDEAWMKRVEEVVNYVLKDNNCYCIINVMHDTGTDGWMHTTEESYAASSAKFKTLWTQIANHFRSYGDHLIFESFNEILHDDSWATTPTASDYDIVNRYNQDFVDAVRATGGNNAYRNIAVTTYAATCDQPALDGFKMPTDIHDNHIYVSVHNYNPYNFCNDNSGTNADGSTYDYNIRVFDDDCKAVVDDYMARTSARFNQLGVPYLFGEFGAIDAKKDMGERVKYATYVATQMKKYNTTGLWWMGLYDRTTHEWYEEEIVDALKAVLGK